MSENDEQLISDALAALDGPSPSTDEDEEAAPEPSAAELLAAPVAPEDEPPAEMPVGPTLSALAADRSPKESIVCRTCPQSVWFASPGEVKCFCMIMRLMVWTTGEPTEITHCDGPFMAIE